MFVKASKRPCATSSEQGATFVTTTGHSDLDARGTVSRPPLSRPRAWEIPIPGETALVTAAIFVGTTDRPIIAFVTWRLRSARLSAITSRTCSDAGSVTRSCRATVTWRESTRAASSSGNAFFVRHGAKVVFFGRFVAVLRALAALHAGINCMGWRWFLLECRVRHRTLGRSALQRCPGNGWAAKPDRRPEQPEARVDGPRWR